MVGKTVNITPAQERRFQIGTQEVGCVPCIMEGLAVGDEHRFVQAQANHVLDPKTGNRMGHDFFIPECPWHHMGTADINPELESHFLTIEMALMYGPSRALNKPAFHAKYGSDEELVRFTNLKIEEFESRNPARYVGV